VSDTVVHFVHDGAVGGIQRIVKGAFLDDPAPRYRHVAIIALAFGKVIGAGPDRFCLGMKNGFDIAAFLRIHRIMRAFPGALLLLHIDMPLARLFLPRRYPIVLLEHGCVAIRGKFRTLNRLLGIFARRRALRAVCISDQIRKAFEREMPFCKGKATVISNPALVPFTAPRQGPSSPAVIGFVGRFVPEKGPLDFCACAGEIHRRNANTRFVMIGGGPLLEKASAFASDAGIPIAFIGEVPDIVPYLRDGIDILAVTSHADAFNMAAAEAMASGIPVAAYPAGALPEVLAHGEAGFLSSSAQPGALAQTVLEVLSDTELYRSMSQAAFAHARVMFDPLKYRDRWNRLFAELEDRKKKGTAT
jgi:glycosyltransferase involved in cell wall biosynthesis